VQRSAAIRAHLERIQASGAFARADTLSRLLGFLVDRALAGRSAELREYVLADEVFSRGAGFDPQTDTIVRVQASRLRSRLKEYYDTEGAGEQVRIHLTRGSYVPRFEVASERPAPPSLAVLPLQNFTGDDGLDYVSDGLTEEIINVLARIEGLRVVARTSVFAFKHDHGDIRAIAGKLGARMVLEGSVRRDGDTVRVTAQLIDGDSGFHLFSANYERTFDTLFGLQDDIARRIVSELTARFPAQLGAPAGVAHVPDPVAYSRYLQAMHHLRRLTPSAMERGIALLQEALAIDGGYADAQALLAAHLTLLGWMGLRPPRQTFPHVEALASAALAADPGQAMAMSSLSFVRAFHWDTAGALDRAEQACEAAPGDSLLHAARAYWLLAAGRPAGAVAAIREAASADPLNLLTRFNVGFVSWMAGQPHAAIAALDDVLELDPNYAEALCNKAAICAELGDFDRALACAARGQQQHGGAYMIEVLAYCYGKSGREGDARRAIAALTEASDTYVAPLRIALAWSGLGDAQQVFDHLEGAFDDQDPRLVWLHVWPPFRPFHLHPRFAALAARLPALTSR
jgi:adenylate cyclase